MIDRMKALDRRLHDAIVKGDLDVVDEVCTPGFIGHDATVPGGEIRGRDAYKLYLAGYRVAFPDLAIEDLVVAGEGDHLFGRMRLSGTHQGELMGIAPTGKKVAFEGAFAIRFEGDLEAEAWLYPDLFTMFTQLGTMPKLEAPAAV